MNNYSGAASNGTGDYFDINSDWITDAVFWTPSVLLGLPLNIIVILLSRKATARTLGNFRLTIRSVAIVNALHCIARAIVLAYYFIHYFFALETSLIVCSVISNLFMKWMGYYMVFFIPLLGGYRFVLLCVKNGEKYLTKLNLYVAIGVIVALPTVVICGRFAELLKNTKIRRDSVCGFKYSDRGCNWCYNFGMYAAYGCYALSLIFATCLFIQLWRTFHKIAPSGMSVRRLSDEIAILACIVIQTIIPILLTLPANGRQFLGSIGFGRVGSAFAGTLYNYNPVFDALLIVIFVKPFRKDILRLMHVRGREEHVTGSRAAILPRNAFNIRASPIGRHSRPRRDAVGEMPSIHI